MVNRTRFLVTASAVAIAALLGACSSGESTTGSTPTTTAAPTTTAGDAAAAKATFLADGNAICATMNDESAALTASYGPEGPTTVAETTEMLLANADLIDQAIADLRALPQPPGDEAQLSTMYEAVGELSGMTRTLSAAMTAGDDAGVADLLAQGDAAQAAANETYTAYGLVECGKG